MKKTILVAAMSAVLLSASPVFAQSAPTDKGTQVKSSVPTVAEFDKQMAQAQENMKKMQELMDNIRQTQDPQERQKLLQDHWATMQGNMQMMHGMGGAGMMGCCTGGHMMGHNMMMGGSMMGWQGYSKLTPEQMKQRQYMMDRYMGMQQQTMDHMMPHQQYMRPR